MYLPMIHFLKENHAISPESCHGTYSGHYMYGVLLLGSSYFLPVPIFIQASSAEHLIWKLGLFCNHHILPDHSGIINWQLIFQRSEGNKLI